MQVQTDTTPRRNRCSLCRQVGHNQRNCPHTTEEATRLRIAFNTEQRQKQRQERQQLQQETQRDNQYNAEWRANIFAQVVNMEERLAAIVDSQPTTVVPRSGPTVRERKIQEIIFENSEMIPNGLYKELMDALVIRD